MSEKTKENSFSFDNVGRSLPFKVPEGFFADLETGILQRAFNDTDTAPRKMRRLWRILAAATVSAAATVALLLSFDAMTPTYAAAEQITVEQAFNNLSQADQDYIIDTFRNDFIIDY